MSLPIRLFFFLLLLLRFHIYYYRSFGFLIFVSVFVFLLLFYFSAHKIQNQINYKSENHRLFFGLEFFENFLDIQCIDARMCDSIFDFNIDWSDFFLFSSFIRFSGIVSGFYIHSPGFFSSIHLIWFYLFGKISEKKDFWMKKLRVYNCVERMRKEISVFAPRSNFVEIERKGNKDFFFFWINDWLYHADFFFL